MNHDKCKYIIVRPKKFREDTMKVLETQPMGMGGVVIKHSANKKYLGE